jgi:hypothetical protein
MAESSESFCQILTPDNPESSLLLLERIKKGSWMKTFIQIIKRWLPLAIAIAGLCGLVYLTVQQSLRMGANDPQIQMAEDAALALNAGASLESVVPTPRIEITTSLAPFIMVFDNSGKLVAASARLHGAAPLYPAGVLDYTRKAGEDRVTWQPEPGVRLATVVVRYDKGYVLAGRSLREVEKRVNQVEILTGLAMMATWITTFIVIALGELVGREKRS